jgi:hypothetical protein
MIFTLKLWLFLNVPNILKASSGEFRLSLFIERSISPGLIPIWAKSDPGFTLLNIKPLE